MLMPFRAPSDYYCDALASIDEKICALIAKRKEISEDNPGFPQPNQISAWCQKYALNEDMILRLFGYMYSEHHFVPLVEPAGFLKFVPILKSVNIVSQLIRVNIYHLENFDNFSNELS